MDLRIKKAAFICAVIAGLSLSSCDNAEKKSEAMQNNQDSTTVFSCPMHPQIKGKEGDSCPKCGMDLVAEKQETDGYQISLRSEDFEAGKPANIQFTITHEGRKPSLEISHEKKIHLMIVSNDLQWFRHIHPQEQSDGSFAITETFPSGGKYIFYFDFKPSGSTAIVEEQEITIKGNTADVEPDFREKLSSDTDGYTLSLENGKDFKTNRTQPFSVLIKKDGRKISEKEIEPYLGANAHIVMIGKDDRNFLHIHPVKNADYPIYAETKIDKAGIYRIWVQFQTKGKVHTADFTVNVKENENADDEQPHQHQH
jgi:hypothetical protein